MILVTSNKWRKKLLKKLAIVLKYVFSFKPRSSMVLLFFFQLFFPTLDIRDLHRAELHTAVRKPSARVSQS